MLFDKTFGFDQESFTFEWGRAQRELRKIVEEKVHDLLEEHLKTSFTVEDSALPLNLLLVLHNHVDEIARTVFRIYERTLDRQKQTKTLKVLSAIYRKAIVPEIRNEKKWCDEMLFKAAKATGIPGGLFVEILTDLKKDNSVSRDLRKKINSIVPKIRRQLRGIKVKPEQPRRTVTSQQQPALTPEQWRSRDSLSQKEAAIVFDVTVRTIRNLSLTGKLNRTEIGRVCIDKHFEAEYRRRNSPKQN